MGTNPTNPPHPIGKGTSVPTLHSGENNVYNKPHTLLTTPAITYASSGVLTPGHICTKGMGNAIVHASEAARPMAKLTHSQSLAI